MTISKSHLKRIQLADALRSYPHPSEAIAPPTGWVKAMRESLGMSQAQLAKRLHISRQSVQDLEAAEIKRRITLNSLDRLAAAMGCRMVYALVPEVGTPDNLLARRADALAASLMNATDHSMKLEAQGVDKEKASRQRKLLAESLLRGSPRKLWR